jgi:hypothetical protein
VRRASALAFINPSGAEARRLDRTVPQPFWTHSQRGFLRVDYAGALRMIAVELRRIVLDCFSGCRTKLDPIRCVPRWASAATAHGRSAACCFLVAMGWSRSAMGVLWISRVWTPPLCQSCQEQRFRRARRGRPSAERLRGSFKRTLHHLSSLTMPTFCCN